MPRKFHHHRVPPAPRKKRENARTKPAALALGFLVAIFGAGYFVTINLSSSKGYQIRTLETQIAGLKEESAKLELQVAQEQSVQAVESKVQGLGMVPTPKIEYLAVTASTVAQR